MFWRISLADQKLSLAHRKLLSEIYQTRTYLFTKALCTKALCTKTDQYVFGFKNKKNPKCFLVNVLRTSELGWISNS